MASNSFEDSMSEEKPIEALGKLAVEYWRLLRSYERVIATLPPDNRMMSVARNGERKLQSILESAEIAVISYEGQDYSPNLAVSLINLDEFGASDLLKISQMIEPTLMHAGEVISVGKAVAVKI
jgi:hypothetical protein